MDADVLITESCPITSLIQRMGRCNRAREPRLGAGEVWVYKPDEKKPYDDIALTGVDEFLAGLSGGDAISQSASKSHLKTLLLHPSKGTDWFPS